ncbi:hypothetical protein AAG570_010974 [Ranatra chinensis]|uniref:Uncharacterized protein n=1 Tax=Ranatra chinensis TaxID=642074 RepID=A0ABD0YJ87_9HEMI
MASKRRNMLHKNKTQETTENGGRNLLLWTNGLCGNLRLNLIDRAHQVPRTLTFTALQSVFHSGFSANPQSAARLCDPATGAALAAAHLFSLKISFPAYVGPATNGISHKEAAGRSAIIQSLSLNPCLFYFENARYVPSTNEYYCPAKPLGYSPGKRPPKGAERIVPLRANKRGQHHSSSLILSVAPSRLGYLFPFSRDVVCYQLSCERVQEAAHALDDGITHKSFCSSMLAQLLLVVGSAAWFGGMTSGGAVGNLDTNEIMSGQPEEAEPLALPTDEESYNRLALIPHNLASGTHHFVSSTFPAEPHRSIPSLRLSVPISLRFHTALLPMYRQK